MEYRRATYVEWGSITKGVVAAAVTAAVDAGLIGSDEPAGRVIDGAGAYTVHDLVRHTSGLRRSHRGMHGGLWSDPFAPLAYGMLPRAALEPERPPGEFRYSNLGYALLGRILTERCGDWWQWCVTAVLRPAGVSTATLSPPDDDRVLPRRTGGRSRQPWAIGATPYAPSGGIWSHYEDLERFADWSLQDERRRDGWRREGDAVWINGQMRDSGVCVVAHSDGRRVAVAHTLRRAPYAADKIAVALLRAGAATSDS